MATAMAISWIYLPTAARVLALAVLLSVISVTTPFWAYVYLQGPGHSTFGLWHYCGSDVLECSSLHDYIVYGRRIPMWFHVVQGTFTIGVVVQFVATGTVVHCSQRKRIQMSPTTNMTVLCLLCIALFKMCAALYFFIIYFDELDFLYEPDDFLVVDFYGSFYVAIASVVCTLFAIIMLYVGDELHKPIRRPDPRTCGCYMPRPKVYPVQYEPLIPWDCESDCEEYTYHRQSGYLSENDCFKIFHRRPSI